MAKLKVAMTLPNMASMMICETVNLSVQHSNNN